MAYPVHLEVLTLTDAHVAEVSVELRALGKIYTMQLSPGDDPGNFIGNFELEQPARYLGVQLICNDGVHQLLCHDGIVFTESLQGQSLKYLLEPSPGGVFARRVSTDSHWSTLDQFTGGLTMLAILGAWAYQRVRHRG